MKKLLVATVFMAFSAVLVYIFINLKKSEKSFSQDSSQKKREIVLLSWKDYTHPDILDVFRKETGISVKLIEFDTLDMGLSMIQSNPGKYDLMVLDIDYVSILKKRGLILPLKKERLPELENVVSLFREHISHAVPYLWGAVGFVVNTDFIDPEKALERKVILDSALRNRVLLLDDNREVINMLYFLSGRDISNSGQDDIPVLQSTAEKLVANGVEFDDVWDSIERVMSGEKWIAQAYSGDLLYRYEEKKNLKFIIPDGPFNIWLDSFGILKGCSDKEAVYEFLSFMMRKNIMKMSAERYKYKPGIDPGEETPFSYGGEDFMEKVNSRGVLSVTEERLRKDYKKIFSFMKRGEK
ncbi:MAG: extracellular solute-binding protein [bacterium]